MDNSKEQPMEWISVTDRLPDWWDYVLVCEHKRGIHHPVVYVGYIDNDKWYYFHELGEIEYRYDNPDYLAITHWMPMIRTPYETNHGQH